MNISKILYWFVFICIFLYASYLSITGYQTLGFSIFFILGMIHAIVFHIAEKSFTEIRSKIREVVFWISGGIHAVWKDKLIIVFAFIAILSVISIVLIFLFFSLKSLLCKSRAFLKAFR